MDQNQTNVCACDDGSSDRLTCLYEWVEGSSATIITQKPGYHFKVGFPNTILNVLDIFPSCNRRSCEIFWGVGILENLQTIEIEREQSEKRERRRGIK